MGWLCLNSSTGSPFTSLPVRSALGCFSTFLCLLLFLFFPRSVLSQGSESPEQHGDYWEAVTQFVLQGRVDQARNLLRLHSEFTTDPFSSLDELLRKMPVCSAASSATQFEFSWRAWQVEVRTRKLSHGLCWHLFSSFFSPGDLETAGG